MSKPQTNAHAPQGILRTAGSNAPKQGDGHIHVKGVSVAVDEVPIPRGPIPAPPPPPCDSKPRDEVEMLHEGKTDKQGHRAHTEEAPTTAVATIEKPASLGTKL